MANKKTKKLVKIGYFFKFFMNRILALPLWYQRENFLYNKREEKYDNDKIDDDVLLETNHMECVV